MLLACLPGPEPQHLLGASVMIRVYFTPRFPKTNRYPTPEKIANMQRRFAAEEPFLSIVRNCHTSRSTLVKLIKTRGWTRKPPENLEGEIWRIVPKYLKYQISNKGRVRSKSYPPFCGLTFTLLQPEVTRCGYLRVTLYRKRKCKRFGPHQLVMRAFVGPYPENKQINHKDGDKTNNCLENLEYVTPRENALHALKTGLRIPLRGEESSNARLTEKQIREIFKRRKFGESAKKLAEDYNTTDFSIYRILRGERWSYLNLVES